MLDISGVYWADHGEGGSAIYCVKRLLNILEPCMQKDYWKLFGVEYIAGRIVH